MRGYSASTKISSLPLVIAMMLAMALLLSVASRANAQAADDQYGEPVAPSGPAAGEPVTVLNDTDGVVGPGDVLVIEGEYDVADGASVTLQDSDATQGTLIDDVNAVITEGSIIITVTDWPIINTPGANGVLDTDGLFVVATTGISAEEQEEDASGAPADDGAGEDRPTGAAAGLLPDTGGAAFVFGLAALALAGVGLIPLRLRHRRR